MKSTKEFAMDIGSLILKGIGLREVIQFLPTVETQLLIDVVTGALMMVGFAKIYLWYDHQQQKLKSKDMKVVT